MEIVKEVSDVMWCDVMCVMWYDMGLNNALQGIAHIQYVQYCNVTENATKRWSPICLVKLKLSIYYHKKL